MLDARQLEALAAVVEHGSFGAAAQALSLTLAAVSLRIKALEDTLGQRLLVRGKQVRATPAGQSLLAHVKQVRMMEADLLGLARHVGAQGAALAIAECGGECRLGGQLVFARCGPFAFEAPFVA